MSETSDHHIELTPRSFHSPYYTPLPQFDRSLDHTTASVTLPADLSQRTATSDLHTSSSIRHAYHAAPSSVRSDPSSTGGGSSHTGGGSSHTTHCIKFTPSSTEYSTDEVFGIEDDPTGKLVLGRISVLDSHSGNSTSTGYTMRYTIDHSEQSRLIGKVAMFDECVPCYNVEARHSVPGWIWAFFRSEAFLYTLHMASLTVGAIKETMDLRQHHEYINLESSILETLATLTLIIIRIGNARRGYSIVHRSLTQLENVRKDNAHLKAMRFWLYVYVTIAVCLAVICSGAFFIFLAFIHLGWTILSNQFCLISIMVASGLYVSRVSMTVYKIREDQHKAVLYEALRLLESICEFERGGRGDGEEKFEDGGRVGREERKRVTQDVFRFIEAVNHTRLFMKPVHIGIREERLNTAPSFGSAID